MSRKEFAKEVGLKIEKIRKLNHISVTNMAQSLYVNRVTYVRNESGLAIPNFFTLYHLGSDFNVSLDWLLLDEGPMMRTQKSAKQEEKPAVDPLTVHPVTGEIKELLVHMDKIPLLRYEILAQFHRFKEEHNIIVEKTMKPNSAN
ncbi:MAG: helix-turn-helix domain-containing protein [Acidobacteria bacterium]|jgi:transcriptional regulator with XRE-family HTH domain|nr:helix-turn-helix domain-containing protein [Acidobacteriota bacterium]